MERVYGHSVENQSIASALMGLMRLVLRFIIQLVRYTFIIMGKTLVYIYKLCATLMNRFFVYWRSERAHEQRTRALEWSIDAGQNCWDAAQLGFLKMGSLMVICGKLFVKLLRHILRYILIAVLWMAHTVGTACVKFCKGVTNTYRRARCSAYITRKRGVKNTIDGYRQNIDKIMNAQMAEDEEDIHTTDEMAAEPEIIEEAESTDGGGFIGYIGRSLIRFVDTLTNET